MLNIFQVGDHMFAHTTTVLVVFMLIIYALNNCRSKQSYFRRAALHCPAKSAWSKLLASNEDVAFTLMSVFRAFDSVCGVLHTHMDVERERYRARRASVTSLVDYTWVYVGSTASQT